MSETPAKQVIIPDPVMCVGGEDVPAVGPVGEALHPHPLPAVQHRAVRVALVELPAVTALQVAGDRWQVAGE